MDDKIIQLSLKISAEGGRERAMRNIDRMIDAEPYVIYDDR